MDSPGALFNSRGQHCCVPGLYIVLNRYFFLVHPVFSEENAISREKNLLPSLGEKRNLLAGSPIFMRTERGPIAKGLFCSNERSSDAVIRLLNVLYLC